jgi:hypothetical protein
MSWGLLIPGFWMVVFAFFAIDGRAVSLGGAVICACGAALCAWVIVADIMAASPSP